MGAALSLCVLALCSASAPAAGPPQIESSFVEDVSSAAALLRGSVNPQGSATTYFFEYIPETAYEANLAAIPPREGFFGAVKKPPIAAGVGSGSSPISVSQQPSGLPAATAYRYRLVASNGSGTVIGPLRRFETIGSSPPAGLLDDRGWEMVSPIDKAGGAIEGFGQNFGGDALQAAADGESATYSSATSFGEGAQGSPPASQYLARRSPGGWVSENITTPLLSGSYGDIPTGVPYQLFSTDLFAGLLSNGERCRGQAGGPCPVANPPLPGSDAVAGYRDYYRRDSTGGGFESLLDAADLSHTSLGPEQLELRFAGSSLGLDHVILESCAALAPGAIEVPAPGGCDEDEQNLYASSPGAGLALVNFLPGESSGTPGAALGAQAGAISVDGTRIYWRHAGNLYLREGSQSKLLPSSGSGVFQVASADGRFAFFFATGHLYRYDALAATSTDLTPAGGVAGVLGAAADGTRVYYQDSTGLFYWQAGGATQIAAGAGAAAASNYPPATGSARVSADGSHLLFLSTAELTGYENQGKSEVFLFGPQPGGGQLRCISCRPSGERPAGPSSIPGAIVNGPVRSYKPRALAASGNRAFFDSEDALVISDTNNRPDVYEWEAQGVGDCARTGGCLGLISDGRSGAPSSFVDASADGSDVFFLTEASLYGPDPGAYDLYDAREGGGFPAPILPTPCRGDACQLLPAAPEDPTPATLGQTATNLPLRFPGSKKKKNHRKKHNAKKHHGKGQKGRGGKGR